MTTTQPETDTTRQATVLERGRRVIRLECEALAEVERRLDDRFARAVNLIAGSTGRVIVAGVGNSQDDVPICDVALIVQLLVFQDGAALT